MKREESLRKKYGLSQELEDSYQEYLNKVHALHFAKEQALLESVSIKDKVEDLTDGEIAVMLKYSGANRRMNWSTKQWVYEFKEIVRRDGKWLIIL